MWCRLVDKNLGHAERVEEHEDATGTRPFSFICTIYAWRRFRY